MNKRQLSAGLVGVFAVIRLAYVTLRALLLYGILLLAVIAILSSLEVADVHNFGMYFDKVPLEASLTLAGILVASIGAIAAWRRQKSDELLLSAAEEVWRFFNAAGALIIKVHGHVKLLKELQKNVKNDNEDLNNSRWMAAALSNRTPEVQSSLDQFHQLALSVYSLDSCHVQALTAHPTIFKRFKAAKAALLEMHKGSTPFSRTLTIRPIQAMRSVHDEA